MRPIFSIALPIAITLGMIMPATAESGPRPAPPFVATLSNHIPLKFGMKPAEAADALRTVLTRVRGGPENEVYLAVRSIGGSLFFPRQDHLYLQFRHGRLTGWKGEWNLDETWR